MSDKRMLILPEEIVRKINENRGDLSQGDFIEFLIESHFRAEKCSSGSINEKEFQEMNNLLLELKAKLESVEKKAATRDELQAFQEDTRKLLKSFLDFFVGYGLELGNHSLSGDLKELSSSLGKVDEGPGEQNQVKIKWKKE
ncbi:MAG: hypothetical protein PHT28_02920 [Dehalococcoidales bacterium]|jgi:hypothetical protein|nr:hypothetical protein [Dehalococcoidales bacterium]MDD4231027.1 hypothetical protein [Dehalococcoidales bacterium]MDD5402167.1 hypothetical protein [Dehalococcoidales bacterium]